MRNANKGDVILGFIFGAGVAVILWCIFMALTITPTYERNVKSFLHVVAPDYNPESLYTCLNEGQTLGVKCSIILEEVD